MGVERARSSVKAETSLSVRLLFGLGLLGLLFAGSSSQAGQLTNYAWNPANQACSGPFDCAYKDMIDVYGPPGQIISCDIGYNSTGGQSTASCSGTYGIRTIWGFARLTCASGETNYSTGCYPGPNEKRVQRPSCSPVLLRTANPNQTIVEVSLPAATTHEKFSTDGCGFSRSPVSSP